MPNLTKVTHQSLVASQRRAAKKYSPVSNFLKIIANEASEEFPDLTNAEVLAKKAWAKATSDDRDSLHWAVMLMDRVEGRVAQEVKVSDPNAIVEQLYVKLAVNGMSNGQIRETLIGMGVDESLLPPPEEPVIIIEGEVVASKVN